MSCACDLTVMCYVVRLRLCMLRFFVRTLIVLIVNVTVVGCDLCDVGWFVDGRFRFAVAFCAGYDFIRRVDRCRCLDGLI